MSKYVHIARLVERVNDEGENVLSGWFGNAKIVGYRGRPTDAGNETWLLFVTEPDERARGSRRGRGEFRPQTPCPDTVRYPEL